MIYNLTIKNIALIHELVLQFEEGLNVLSGETGAGKSIIVDSMNLILGERADRELIRTGESGARVEAVFYLDNSPLSDLFEKYGVNEADELIISRELTIDGRNTCRINGAVVNLATLKEFTDRIVDLHGQHEHQYLLQSKTHISFVDAFGGVQVEQIKNSVSRLYKEYKSLMRERDMIGGSPEERARSIDLLKFVIDEIENAAVKPGEESSLREELAAMVNAEKIAGALEGCHSVLYADQDSVLSRIARISRELEGISSYSEKYASIAERLGEIYYNLEDVAQEAQKECESVFYDQERVIEIQERLDILFALKRKYGGSEESIVDYLKESAEKLEKLENSDKMLAQVEKNLDSVKRKLYEQYLVLSKKRREISQELKRQIESELKDLGMSTSRFEVRFEDLPSFESTAFSESGPDKIEFTISTNIGEPLKPLSKIVSGGEVSRIMLAFKNVLANTDSISTLIFDEIDTGISGNMAHVVAEKLSKISRRKQVICVTHLPQIAAIADANYLISKNLHDGKMLTHVEKLDENGKISEVSRLSGGGDSKSSLDHASEMIINANALKNQIR